MICAQCGREFKARGAQRYCPVCHPPKKSQQPKTCPVCGKEYVPHSAWQKYCSAQCQKQDYRQKHSRKLYTHCCATCGQEFQSFYAYARYCSDRCRSRAAAERFSPGGPDRELTGLTVYLVHKYAAEGMGVPEIANVLRRSDASIQGAMSRRLTPYQEKCLRLFLKDRRR